MPTGERTTVIACATVIKETMPHVLPDGTHRALGFELHANPDMLTRTLQETIDPVPSRGDHLPPGCQENRERNVRIDRAKDRRHPVAHRQLYCALV